MVSNNSWNSEDPAQVQKGGTGNASFSPFEVVASGTTLTNPLQSINNGNIDEVLTSNGPGVLPSFQPSGAGETGAFVWLDQLTANNDSQLMFDNTVLTSTYNNYLITINGAVPFAISQQLSLQFSIDNGINWLDSDYKGITSLQTTNITDMYPISPSGSSGVSNEVLEGWSGQIFLYDLRASTRPRISSVGVSPRSSTNITLVQSGGYGPSGIVVNAIRFMFNSSNISTGKFNLYGVKTS